MKGKKELINLNLLFDLEIKYPGIFIKSMNNFGKVKELKTTLNDKGVPEEIPWEEAFKKFYLTQKYSGIDKDNIDIAELFSSRGISQTLFDDTVSLRKMAKEKSIPEHLLGKELKEETVLESIEKIREKTEDQILKGMNIIENLYEKKFTYEWLNKNDPHNSILGLFCSCCGTIASVEYGRNIAAASIIAKDVQNLVVRDSNGIIVAKGTVFLKKDRGFAVINDFEINQKYRKHEVKEGVYAAEEQGSEEQDRELIYKAFIRGIKAFIEEYDKQNPDNPLKQVNVGYGYNRLKRQVDRLKKSEKNFIVPDRYSFWDAIDEQYIIYEREEKGKEDLGGIER